MRLRAETLLVLGALIACERKPTPAPDAAVATQAVTAAAPSVTEPIDAGQPPAANAISAPWECSDASDPRTGRTIGHTSVVYRLWLKSGKQIAWKPNAKKVAGRYKGEIAAYRLARLLDLPNVVPACPRTYSREIAVNAISDFPAGLKLFEAEAIVDDGKVHGAAMPWIEGLQFWPLEKDPLASEVKTWLTAGKEIPQTQRDFARQASTLFVFDYLTGNWDRFSGANVGLDSTGKLVLYIDNDAGFMAKPPADADKKNLARVRTTDRFSRKLVEKLRALTADAIGEALREEEPGRELLTPAVRNTVWTRVTSALKVIDEKTKERGETETLFFP